MSYGQFFSLCCTASSPKGLRLLSLLGSLHAQRSQWRSPPTAQTYHAPILVPTPEFKPCSSVQEPRWCSPHRRDLMANCVNVGLPSARLVGSSVGPCSSSSQQITTFGCTEADSRLLRSALQSPSGEFERRRILISPKPSVARRLLPLGRCRMASTSGTGRCFSCSPPIELTSANPGCLVSGISSQA